jgi:hypothetical protein
MEIIECQFGNTYIWEVRRANPTNQVEMNLGISARHLERVIKKEIINKVDEVVFPYSPEDCDIFVMPGDEPGTYVFYVEPDIRAGSTTTRRESNEW